jgi:hypothetical protein
MLITTYAAVDGFSIYLRSQSGETRPVNIDGMNPGLAKVF